MVKYTTDNRLSTRIVMFDSNRNEENILYRTDFDQCVRTNNNLKIIYSITGEGQEGPSSSITATAATGGDWKGEIGFINKEMLSPRCEVCECLTFLYTKHTIARSRNHTYSSIGSKIKH
jgi:Oxidoreductase NAD-binding domain